MKVIILLTLALASIHTATTDYTKTINGETWTFSFNENQLSVSDSSLSKYFLNIDTATIMFLKLILKTTCTDNTITLTVSSNSLQMVVTYEDLITNYNLINPNKSLQDDLASLKLALSKETERAKLAEKALSDQLFKKERIVFGKSNLSDWQTYAYSNGNARGFKIDIKFANPRAEIPYVTTTLHGINHWNTMGVTSIYNLTNQGFTVYIYPSQQTMSFDSLKTSLWEIQYIAIYDI
jgi:hypothetical protein